MEPIPKVARIGKPYCPVSSIGDEVLIDCGWSPLDLPVNLKRKVLDEEVLSFVEITTIKDSIYDYLNEVGSYC